MVAALSIALAVATVTLAQEPQLGLPPRASADGPKMDSVSRDAKSQVAAAWYDTSSRSNVRSLYNSIFAPSRTVPLGWAGNVVAGVWGDTSQAYKDTVAARLNWLRALAGVPAVITLNTTFNYKDQQAAMMMSVNKQLSHYPPPSWTNYTAEGAEAAANSNICLGFSNDPGCVELYMQDFGTHNTAAGHRRWILYPQTQQFGTGDVPATSAGGYPSSNAMWVFDGNYGTTRPSTRDNFVAWPPPGYFPYQLEPPRWSFSYPNANFSSSSVTMSRGGVAVPVTLETVEDGYGENTVVWYPSSQNPAFQLFPSAPASDTTVVIGVNNVLISGSPQNFSYQVITFDPATGGGAPSVITMSPQSGSSVVQTFTFTFRDPDGYANLDVVNVLINNFLDGRFACYIAYSRTTNVLYLVNDTGTALLPGLVMNGTGATGNSFCSITGAGSSASGAGSDLTLSLNMAFNSTNFAGDKVVYLAARDLASGNSGWQTRGVWRIPLGGAALTVAGLTPGSGIGAKQTFTLTFRDPSAATNITNAQLLINADLNGSNACYLGYVRAMNLLYLVSDLGSGLEQPPITPNTGAGTAQNSQCILSGEGTTANISGTDLTLTINLTFKAGFAGGKVVYAAAQSGIGGNSGWQARGVWVAP